MLEFGPTLPENRAVAKSTMKIIQIVLDAKLLQAADIAARRQEVSRSARIRQALQEHLKRLHVAELDARHQPGYQARPQRLEEYRPWEETAAWPQE